MTRQPPCATSKEPTPRRDYFHSAPNRQLQEGHPAVVRQGQRGYKRAADASCSTAGSKPHPAPIPRPT
eukprot:1929111-Pyramimonas_sp.AAC.1